MNNGSYILPTLEDHFLENKLFLKEFYKILSIKKISLELHNDKKSFQSLVLLRIVEEHIKAAIKVGFKK